MPFDFSTLSTPDGTTPCAPLKVEIPIFAQLLAKHPTALNLIPRTFPRQETARRIIKPGDRNHWVGLFSSRTNQALVPFESGLERKAFCVLETHPTIRSYRSQPYCIVLRIDGRTCTVYPDVELTTDKGAAALLEVKPATQVAKPRNQRRFDALRSWAAHRGMQFSVLTEQEIEGQRLTSATWLLSLTRGQCEQRLREATFQWLGDNTDLTFRRALELTTHYPAVHSAICELVLDGFVAVDFDRPLESQLLSLNYDMEA